MCSCCAIKNSFKKSLSLVINLSVFQIKECLNICLQVLFFVLVLNLNLLAYNSSQHQSLLPFIVLVSKN